MSEGMRETLPGGDAGGQFARWVLPTVTDDDPEVHEGVMVIDGTFLGVGSSRRTRHSNHLTTFATKRDRCGVCRWFETRLFRVGDNEYVLHHVGRSIVPGEQDFMRHERAFSAVEVIERYTARLRDSNEPYLGKPAALALSQACVHDDEVRDAYENRVVL